MTHHILGSIIIILGYLVFFGDFDNGTKHYSVQVYVSTDEYNLHTLTFSTMDNEALTTDFLKRKFDYDSNVRLIIWDIKSITKDEKDKILNKDKEL